MPTQPFGTDYCQIECVGLKHLFQLKGASPVSADVSLSWLHEFISLHDGMKCGTRPDSHTLSTKTTKGDNFDTFF